MKHFAFIMSIALTAAAAGGCNPSGEGKTAEFMDAMLAKADPEYAANPDIKWNFTKFLVDRNGQPVARFEPTVAPEQIEKDIQTLL